MEHRLGGPIDDFGHIAKIHGVANADDVLALIAGQEDGETLPLYRSDINRDGVFSLADALRILDLLTEPDVFRKTLRE